MRLVNYKKHFSDYQQGAKLGSLLLSAPVMPLKDAPLSEQSVSDMKQTVALTQKNYATNLILSGESDLQKANVLCHLAYRLHKPILFITQDYFAPEHKHSLAGLFADAELTQGILFFDEADALFESALGKKNAEQVFAMQSLLKHASALQGLTVFSVSKPKIASFLGMRIKHHVAVP